jgi:hypothetical protein
MFIEYERVNEEGFIIENQVFEEGTQPEGWLDNLEIPQGLFKPRWNGSEWVEGATAEEIEAVKGGAA